MKIITKKKEQKLYNKKLTEDCWSLDYSLIKWLNEHLKKYLEDAGKTIDLDFHKFKYNQRVYTEREMIGMLICITNILIDEDVYYDLDKIDMKQELVNDMYDILKLVHCSLWW